MTDRPLGQPRKTSIVAGLIQLARGDATGIMQFGHTPRSFLLSLIPLLALPLAVSFSMVATGEIQRGLTYLCAAIAALLTSPVITHLLAKYWKRDNFWLRYAIAFNWSQFAITLLLLILFRVLASVMASVNAGQPSAGLAVAIALGFLGLLGYTFWLHWFIARCGLGISRWQAVVVVLATYAGSLAILLIGGPRLMGQG